MSVPSESSEHAPAAAGKWLIVNADDLGLSAGTNRGIFEAHERGIVTSASLMVRWPAAAEAAAYAHGHPGLGVGLHLDFAEWAIHDDQWTRLYQVCDLDNALAVRREVERQIDLFWHVMDRAPTHVDSHQHVHQDVRVRRIVEEAARRLEVPLRHDGRVRYCGDFYGQDEHGLPYPEGISAAALERVVRSVGRGVTEVACHPGYDDALETMYRDERATEVASLCDPRVRRAVEESDVRLVNFAAIGRGT
jgi:predicted glycoside hydrolase/deacetylase ChbG (UPF0249 family)